jgi:hypothetical protein
MSYFSKDPKITYAAIKLQDTIENLAAKPDDDFDFISVNREETLEFYASVFSPQHIPDLSEREFTDFLLYKNNHHWTNLHRVGKFMVQDMELLREALLILLDESIPIEDRINQLRPERYWGSNSMVSYVGMPVLTPILLVNHPTKYGVWNNTSDYGLKLTRLWDARWNSLSTGQAYCEMNQIYRELCKVLQIDLWTLDALWWMIKK